MWLPRQFQPATKEYNVGIMIDDGPGFVHLSPGSHEKYGNPGPCRPIPGLKPYSIVIWDGHLEYKEPAVEDKGGSFVLLLYSKPR